MEIFGNLLLGIYILATSCLLILSLNCWVMVFLFKRKEKIARQISKNFSIPQESLPCVTTQIAIYNEMNVAERVIQAVVAMDYPEHKHFIQVLDDSTDDTYNLVKKLVADLQKNGVKISHLHRENRTGFKAGALAAALKNCQTPFVAIFDADFIPPKDFLLKTMPHFQRGEKIGLIQTRWGHLNRNKSLLTKVQALGIDGHFAVEQAARNWNDLYMNFNGTAGILAVKAIEEAGGWSADTLTEDMDLSYRMQLAGWKSHYLIDVECPAEVPEDMNAFKSQQFRWAKGSLQTAKKIIPKVLKDKVSFFKKLQAVLHTTHYLVHPLMLTLALLAYPVAKMNDFSFGLLSINWVYLTVLFCSTAPTSLYFVAQKSLGGNWLKRFSVYPALMCFGCGMSISNTKACFEALVGQVSDFIRTPKKGDLEKINYQLPLPLIPFLEVVMGVYCLWSLYGFFAADHWLAGTFVSIYAVGFLLNGFLSLCHSGFFKELISTILSPFGGIIFLTHLAFIFLGKCVPGTNDFFYSYLFCALLMIGLWKLSPKNFKASHLLLFALTAISLRAYFINFPTSDDVFRYLWEGKLLNNGIDPFVFSPDSPKAEHLRDELWRGINHKDWTAIYGTVFLLICQFISWLNPSILSFKLTFILFDLATLVILWKLLQKSGKSFGALSLYAFNPLIILAFAGEAHLDSIPICLVLASYYFYSQKKWLFGAILLSMAISCKFIFIIFLPFIWRREHWQQLLVIALTLFLPTLFFEATIKEIMNSLFRFGIEMRFNDSLHYLLYNYFGYGISTLICILLFLILGFFIWLTQDSPWRGAFFACFLFLLLAPTVHYWYVAMLIPFLVLVPSVPAIVWLFSIVFYFNVYSRVSSGEGFTHNLSDQAWQYFPVLIAIILVFLCKIRGIRSRGKSTQLPTLSVLIPVLNEADNCQKIMENLQAQTVKPLEIIAIDGGSKDDTVKKMTEAGAKVLQSTQKGRGNQIYLGLQEAQGDIILVLHADIVPDKNIVEKIIQVCIEDEELVGGAIGASFVASDFKYKVITFLNKLRFFLSGISFGDQGQFFRRKVALENGCLLPIPLMEDVELAIRLQGVGKVVLLDGGLQASVRRWRSRNVWRNAFHIFYLLSVYLLLRRVKSKLNVENFYRAYYK